MVLTHEFVEYIPEVLKPGTIYVSIIYATAVHLCCCGCGNEVVTPLSPTDWKLIFDGESISLYPSIGNWSFPCHSHYWVERDLVIWLPGWSKKEIYLGKVQRGWIKNKNNVSNPDTIARIKRPDAKKLEDNRLGVLRRKLNDWFSRKDL
jgi:hypothetical protein